MEYIAQERPRYVTKLIPALRDLRYEERLQECGLTTLDWMLGIFHFTEDHQCMEYIIRGVCVC